jgi:hypothetical protein
LKNPAASSGECARYEFSNDMEIETDLKKIKETAQGKEDENWESRSFLIVSASS